MIRPRIRDDRGRPKRLCAASRLPAHAPEPVRRAMSLAQLCSLRGMTLATLVALIGAGTTTGFVNTIVGWDWWAYPAFLLWSGAVAIGVLVLATAWGVFAHEPIRAAARRQCLAAGICPSCGFGLRGVAPEADGLVVCPDCGGAWAAPPV